ncbi:MAG: hypothetical protein J6N78_02085 [Clostridia bacterium]|nr:hypothetical protein [Clostridia bacterium]
MEQLLKHISKVHLTVPEALTLLLVHYDANYNDTIKLLEAKELIKKSNDLFKVSQYELTNNANDIVKILLKQNKKQPTKVTFPQSTLDELYNIALHMKSIYPKGHRQGSTKPYAPSVNVIIERLKKLITLFNLKYNPQLYYIATLAYLSDTRKTNPSLKYLMDLDYFILKKDNEGVYRSPLLDVIENKQLNNINNSKVILDNTYANNVKQPNDSLDINI